MKGNKSHLSLHAVKTFAEVGKELGITAAQAQYAEQTALRKLWFALREEAAACGFKVDQPIATKGSPQTGRRVERRQRTEKRKGKWYDDEPESTVSPRCLGQPNT